MESLAHHHIREMDIEREFIQTLQYLKYIFRDDIRDKAALNANFRAKFNALNHVTLTDGEFERLLASILDADVFKASQALREEGYMEREDGTPLHYTLVNLKDWCKNEFEVIHQLRINTDNSNQRYDVILLLNGLPLVQVELKTLGVSPRKAMEQIVRYRNDPGNGYTNTLLCFMQLFIVSNQTQTWYFANNQAKHFSFDADERYLPIYQMADAANRKIPELHAFAQAFLHKCTLGALISRYMVLVQSEQKILVMRPYQIYAAKAIVDCIHENRGNGYIWHTTGSGKTLTSFKASTLLKDNPDIEKCLFVVDRKDLDRQTREEFNRFQPGCVEENTNTGALVRRLVSTDYADKVIVTTIQKLALALDETSKQARRAQRDGRATWKERLAPLADKRLAIIFDECHRSQFGDSHDAIVDFFPKAQLFGFTGTPIFEANATSKQVDGTVETYKTTRDVFQQQLHAYTITHAIDDGNVLRFRIDYFKPEAAVNDKGVGKDAGKAKTPRPDEAARKRAVALRILAKHDTATAARRFNALFATASINDAIAYVELFKELQAERQASDPGWQMLNVACVFSPPADGNQDVKQLQEDLPQELADNQVEPNQKKAALTAIIAAYNAQYGSNHKLSEFDDYYKDVQQRIKDQQYPNADHPHDKKIDITIVVDMLLTGFDSKYLNTLYVDKNLKYHGLIQAFSRTNRVLNDTKPYGNILDFRNQRDEVDKAITLFSGEDNATKAKEIWLVEPAKAVIQKLDTALGQLANFMQANGVVCQPESVANLKGDAARVGFIEHFKEVQKLKTRLDQYTDLTAEQQQHIEQKLPESQLRAFKGVYLDTAQQLKDQQNRNKPGGGAEASVEQLDFEFVLFSSATVDYDYIMGLLAKFSEAKPTKQTMTREQLVSLIASSSNLMDERDEITAYVATLQPGGGKSPDAIRQGYAAFKAQQAHAALAAIAQRHGLAPAALQAFVDATLGRMILDTDALTDLMAPLDLGWKQRSAAELALMADLVPLLTKQAKGREISGLAAYE